ncbi:MAG: Chorismate synthase [Deltaproteobacteria bacterium ADurb.Bin510]|nr:MAG: Chorismate synthase [Deltaproteobacteria bacterium ADurb.Bin510]
MLRFFTAGESHGRGVFTVLDGLPAGLKVERELIDADLKRRQGGYGRGGRMAIEQDRVDVLSGLRGGYTLGTPVVLAVWNRDFENWQDYMDPWTIKPGRELYTPRPGHADLPGAARFRHSDLRNVLERASARETAGRVAAGGLLRSLLKELGLECHSWVSRIADVSYDGPYDASAVAASSVYCPDAAATARMEAAIEQAIATGDTLGGEFKLVLTGLPAGLGSCVQWDKRLDARIAEALISIPGIKAVQFGAGVACASLPGSALHDAILPGHARPTNRAGGLEGGISNGQAIEITCSMKPIPTLKQGLPSIDIRTGEAVAAEYERSDYCAVPAAAVVGEAMLIIAVATAILEDFGSTSMAALTAAFSAQRQYWEAL